jgi:protocatechuate 3,4-dioxygenase alpha subunit
LADATTSQTVGPFFTIGMQWLDANAIASRDVPGERVSIHGRMVDGDGKAVADGFLEIWQPDSEGRFAHPEDPRGHEVAKGFRGFGRAATDERGTFVFTTIKPGRIADASGALQAPFLLVAVFARGMLKQAVTRIYFPDDAANARDPVLVRVEAARRGTLIAKAAPGAAQLEWNVVLQGAEETVFFDL